MSHSIVSGGFLPFGGRLGRRCGLGRSRARLALRRHPVVSRWEVRAQDELALETARLQASVCLGDLIEGDPLGDAQRGERELPITKSAASCRTGRDVALASR